jgi:uroporphyrinogen decarboxylase
MSPDRVAAGGAGAMANPADGAPTGPAAADPVSGSGVTSRDRVRTALAHREPDRIPFDLGGSRMTGIHVGAHGPLRQALLLPGREPRIIDVVQQLADVEPDVLDALGCDVRAVLPRSPASYRPRIREEGSHLTFVDEWGVGRRMPVEGGLYYDAATSPLAGEIADADIDRFPWPDPADPARYEGMAEEARGYALEERRAVHVGSICSGVTEGLFKLRGFEDGYMDLAADPARARRIMERILEIKIEYWSRVLPMLEGLVDVVGEADDLGGQDRTLFSPATYRALVKPFHRELFGYLHAHTDATVFFHSCGAIRDLIPDLIEVGVDALNPVQVSATGMDGAGLKREFGRDLAFWGGGVDTQRVLGGGSPGEVRADVRRRVAALAPGGGFVFATVHNIQPNVPPANILAMWSELREAQGREAALGH